MRPHPRPLDPARDLARVAALLGRTHAAGGIWHPGGIQWWLRLLGREAFEAFVWDGGHDLVAFVMSDDTFVVAESDVGGPDSVELIAWAEERLRETGRAAIETSSADPRTRAALEARGYTLSGSGHELTIGTGGPHRPALPSGYAFGSLDDVGDEAYVELHRAAWSDRRPSTYRLEQHAAVRAMPGFRAELVTIVRAPNGGPAAYCIGWLDPASASVEIEPLGTHRDFRRLGLARAVVGEIVRRAAELGARSVLVWSSQEKYPAAYALYTSCGMAPRRQVLDMRKELMT